jgi:hypothetical protein
MHFNQGVVSSQSLKLIGGSDERNASKARNLFGDILSKALGGVETL